MSETVASGSAKDWAGYLQMVGKREGLMLAALLVDDLIEEDQRGRL